MPQAGDPTALGWAMTALYAVAFLAASVALLRAEGRERVFWALAAAAMLALGVNKELDLQTLLGAAGHCISAEGGWAEGRRAVKKAAIVALTGIVGLSGLVLLWWVRGVLGRVWVAVAGLAVTAVFVVFRAAWLSNLDMPLGDELGHLGVTPLLEPTGVALVAAGAVMALSRGRKARRIRS
jgi:hypothetical protein